MARLWGGGRAGALPYRTLCRQLHRLGPLRPRDWRALARLVGIGLGTGRAGVDLARDSGIDPRTLRHRLRRLLGIGTHEYRERVGWEWILETALRRHGYLRAPERARRRA